MTLVRCLSTCSLIAGLAVPALAAKPPVPQSTLDEVQRIFEGGDCDGALAKTGPLLAKHPNVVELLIVEANCRLLKARSSEEVFDPLRYERSRVAVGAKLIAAGDRSMFVTVPKYDAAERDRALAQLQRAQRLAPSREDILVGYVAALVHSGKTQDAGTTLQGYKGTLARESIEDLAALVPDLLGEGNREPAAALAAVLAARFPASAPVLRAQAAVALAQHDSAAAIDKLAAARAQGADDVALARQLGTLLLMSRRWQETIDVTLPNVSRGDEFIFWLALARLRTTPASALPVFTELRDHLLRSPSPSAPLAKITQHYLRLLKDGREPTEAMRLNAANRFAEWGVPLAGVVELDAAVAADPSSVTAWKRLADLYRDQGALQLALGALDKALAVTKDDPRNAGYSVAELEAARGRLLFGMSRDREALAAFAAARAGGHAAPYEEGVATLASGDKPAALALFEEAVRAGGETGEWARAKVEELTTIQP